VIGRRVKSNTCSNALQLNECLAKTYKTISGEKLAGRQVLNHCRIVGEVARELLKRMPDWLKAELFPKGSELIAASHDIGKVSPTFQERIYRGTKGYKHNSKPELKEFTEPDRENHPVAGWGGHAGVSQAAANAILRKQAYKDIRKYVPLILGQHHGSSPKLSRSAEADEFGGEAWQQRREELLTELKRLLDCDFPRIKSPEQARVLAGLTSVADWIGSSSLFDNPETDWQPLIEKALDNAGFIKPILKTDLSFFDIFKFHPHDSQEKLFENAIQTGVYILEAPMGLGKTEAALYAAYKAMSLGRATGIYFALPTQLTSDKIHDRVNKFLKEILVEGSPHQTALLAHGNAWLKQTELGVEGNPDASWFDDKKRKILAPFAVGTIDQALMAVMNVRHGFVRTFGLAGKVVILDEVHSYDAYTGTILDDLVKVLRELNCTVIILSATLTQERRIKLLNLPVNAEELAVAEDYPLISAVPRHAKLQELTVAPLDNYTVAVHCCQADGEAIKEALKRAEQGQQVLWIENTVAEAQAIFKELASCDIDIEVGLLHSRFLKVDREENEKKWVELYGKDNAVERQAKGRILVGTQVLEQSLDIDADFLVSRFAPTDMLLQRMGRLWRHKNPDRNKSAKREAWLLVPELTAAIENKDLFGDSAFVYAPYVLCRSLAVWHERRSVNLPLDIRTLIEATYVKQAETGKMLRYFSELEEKRKKLEQLARYGLSKAGETLSESTATRYSEQDTVQVLLLSRYQTNTDNTGTEITLLTGEKIVLPRGVKYQDKVRWRELAAKLLKNTVQVASHIAPQAVSIQELMGLKEYVYLGHYESTADKSLLRVALVNESDEIKSLMGGAALEDDQLYYDKRQGYHVKK